MERLITLFTRPQKSQNTNALSRHRITVRQLGRRLLLQLAQITLMKKYSLNAMVKGWFVGNFTPTLFKTNDVEVGVKKYLAGESESLHHHKIATEITVIISGRVRMNGIIYIQGDIIVIDPSEATDFEALEDSVTTVVKFPGANNDKYLGDSL